MTVQGASKEITEVFADPDAEQAIERREQRVRHCGSRVTIALAQVPTECNRGLGSERHGPPAAALAEHVDNPAARLRVDRDVLHAQTGELAATDAGVGKQPDDRRVPTILEP